MITLVVPEPTPSLNKLKGWSWRTYNSIRRNWRLSVWAAAQQAKVGRPMWQRARVRIERYSRGVLDHDNLVGGCKPVVDSLKDCGIVVDDSPKHLELEVTQHKGSPYRTVIRIEELT